MKHLDLSERVLALDPAVRGIGAAERFRRSRGLVQMTLDAAGCLGADPPPSSQDLIDDARKTLDQRVTAAGQDGATETDLDLAGRLWQARVAGCKPAPDPDDPLGAGLGEGRGAVRARRKRSRVLLQGTMEIWKLDRQKKLPSARAASGVSRPLSGAWPA